jgi:hypothetical protein
MNINLTPLRLLFGANPKIRLVVFSICCCIAFCSNTLYGQTQSVARIWNDVQLQAVREDFARPPVQARNFFHVAMAMYDAWAVYDTTGQAKTYLLGKYVGGYQCPFNGLPPAPNTDIEAARKKAMSYAAFTLLKRRYQFSPNAGISLQRFRQTMEQLGYDWTFTNANYQSGDPAELGNYIGNCVGEYGRYDGSNEDFNYGNFYYTPINPLLIIANPGNPNMVDPNRWQPLSLSNAIDQNGNPIPSAQVFQSPEWGRVFPFALPDSTKKNIFRDGYNWPVYHDPGPPPMLNTVTGGGTSDEYKWNFNMVSIWASHLDPTDGVIWDISPASIGNTGALPNNFEEYKTFYDVVNGGNSDFGRPLNPKTGAPYAPQLVPRGDYTRVLAQFWADGPNSETPPGHWFSIFNRAVLDHPQFVRKFNGRGDVLDPLEYDVKAYFTLGGALHDAAITAWGIKGAYDNVRPVSALRYMAQKGQSSDPASPNYNVAGVQLVPGFIEQVKAGDPLAGNMNQNVGKIKFYTWRGHSFITNTATDIAGVGWILAENWTTYQPKTFVSPPFAGYISGHSTYSRTAAEAITRITGDEYFPGGMGEFVVPANSGFFKFENGPSVDVKLQWATFRDASDQTSLSRIWGGIHPPVDDIPGRKLGIIMGNDAFNKASSYFYADNDNDGYLSYQDCDDNNASLNPGMAEVCDGIDNNCDGLIDNGITINTYYVDLDGDGFGNAAFTKDTCLITSPVGFADNALDCDDNNANLNPNAAEICDGIDNNCDNLIDNGITFNTYYADLDGDGFGNAASTAISCLTTSPTGFVANALDCDDNNANLNPNIAEICDGIDNNCDGLIDNGITINTYYADLDGDGFGNAAASKDTCLTTLPVGFVANALDCDDNNANLNPNAVEVCDGIDNNCDNLIDNGLPVNTYYSDNDGDGYGSIQIILSSCAANAPTGYSAVSGDCDDNNALVAPMAPEILDSLDNDCNGLIDDISSTTNLSKLICVTYPNPVTDDFHIACPLQEEVFVRVYNAQGGIVHNDAFAMGNNAPIHVSFSTLPSGIYWIHMSSKASGLLQIFRVIKL